MTKKRQRLCALLLCAGFIMFIFFSILLLVKEADHDCVGADCPVCSCLHQVEQILKLPGGGVLSPFFILPLMIFFTLMVLFEPQYVPCTSLVGKKVRLDD